MIWLLILITLILIGMALITLVNVLTFPRLGQAYSAPAHPLISVLVPARDEAAVIQTTIRCLITQGYLDFEVILLDDHSSDGTAELALAMAEGSPRLRVIRGAPLPIGWLGKNWACHQLAQAARGEWLVFTDADVRWAPGALSALMAEAQRMEADLLTIWPTQESRSWSERLVVPLMALVVVGYLPLPLVHYTSWPAFAAANGQCLAFRRRAYELIGGHVGVKAEVLEDVTLARRIKAHGLRLRMADGGGLVNCRMYSNWTGVRNGFAKNILAGYGGRVTFLGLATLFHGVVFLLPWLWLGLGGLVETVPGWPLWPLVLIGLGVGIRMLTAAATGQRLFDALLMPVSVLLMTWIAGQAVWWQWRYGGPRWKGRMISQKRVST